MYACLVLLDDEDDDALTDDAHAGIWREAKNIIPVLWFSLFSAADMRARREPDPDSQVTIEFPILSAPTALARDRAAVFARRMPDAGWHYARWLEALAAIERPIIQLQALELWSLSPETFGDELLACTRAWDEDRDEDWDVLLGLHDMWPSGAEAAGEELLPWLIGYPF
jgi:hypothetical protein